MATITLHPTQVNNAASQYLTITDASNMYTDTSSTTYATIQNTNASTSSRYIYLKGFNFGDVPSNAEVSSFTVKLKGYYTGGSQQTLYLCNNTTTQSSATATGLTTSTQTRTFSNGSLTWDTISSWGDNFSIRINCRRGNKNTVGYYYIYGAEIDVTYTVPVYYDVTASTTVGSISPSGTTSVFEGDSYTLVISETSSKPTVTDNNVDVTSQLVESTEETEVLVPNGNTVTTFTATNITNAYTDKDSDTYAQLQLAGSSTGTVYLDLQDLSIPSGATITNVSCQVTLQFNANGSSSGFTSSCQMYAGSNAKGTAYQWVSSGSNVNKTTYTLSIGSWTASEINNARFYLTATNSARSTARQIYIYGLSFSVTYESSSTIYIYTISSVNANHTIIVSPGSTTDKIYFKNNGTWIAATKVYKKINGSWVQQSDLTQVFDNSKNYVKGN